MKRVDRYTCAEMLALLDDYLDGCLEAAEAAKIEEHLESCIRCAAEYRFERRLIDGVREKLRESALPGDLVERLRRRLRETS